MLPATSEEVVRRTLEVATSSFIPTPREDTSQRNPFAAEPYGGYRRWLSAIDPDGAWFSMFEPGASGWGLLVSCFNHMVCCYPQSGYMAETDNDGVPLLFPAVVQWHSVVDPRTNTVPVDVWRPWDSDLHFPPVGITSDWWLDEGVLMPWVNLIHHDEAQWEETDLYVGDLNVILTGLAAPWQILPITAEAATTLQAFMTERGNILGARVMSLTNCELCEVSEDDDEWNTWDREDHSGLAGTEPAVACGYSLGEYECRCGEQPTKVQLWDALVAPLLEGALTTEDLFVPPDLHPLWRLAQHCFAVGWLAVAARSAQGDAWSTFCWQRSSPFSGSHSLAMLLQRLSTPSTSSGTLPGSSTASSPQLTLFGS